MKKYENYKDSGIEWVGQIPVHWEAVKLKYSAIINNGKDYKHIEDPDGIYPVIGSGWSLLDVATTYLVESKSSCTKWIMHNRCASIMLAHR